MRRNRIRLTESQLHRAIKESVKNVIKESIIDRQFGISDGAGSFESAIYDAWKLADSGNKEKLEDAFPEFFNKEAMYGSSESPFDFRDFPTKQHYDDFYKNWKNR